MTDEQEKILKFYESLTKEERAVILERKAQAIERILNLSTKILADKNSFKRMKKLNKLMELYNQELDIIGIANISYLLKKLAEQIDNEEE